MWKRILKWLTAIPVLVAAGLVAAYLLFGYFAVDPLAKRILPWVAENKLASRASVGRVEFDPFRLSASIENFRLTQANGAPLASFEHLYADLQFSGLFKWAWYLKNVRLTAPKARFDIAPGGKLNWADLIAKVTEDKTKSDTMPRLLIERIRIERGDIEYTDRNRPSLFKAVLEPLGLELDGLSTLPEDRGDYLFAAKLPEQGGTLKWKGDVGLNPVVSRGEVALSGVKLAKLMRIVKKADLPFKPEEGEIDAGLAYDFALVKDKPQTVLTKIALKMKGLSGELGTGQVALKSLDLSLPRLDFAMQQSAELRFKGLNVAMREFALTQAGNALLSLPQAEVGDVDFDLAARAARVGRIALVGGAVRAVRDQDGQIDWQRLVVGQPAAEPEKAPQPAAAEKPFAIDIVKVDLQDWRFAYVDRTFRHPLAADLAGFKLGFGMSNPGGHIRVAGLESEAGPLTLKSELFSQPAMKLARLRVAGGEADLDQKAVKIESIVVSGLVTQVLREAGKPLNWQAILEPQKPAPTAAGKPAGKLDWSLALSRLALENANVHVEDKAAKKTVALDIGRAMLEVRNVTLDLARALPVKAAFRVRQGGQFETSGKLAPQPLKGELNLKLAGLALKPLAPYVNRVARLNLDDGVANASGKLTLKPGKTMSLRFDGGFALNKLAITEEEGGAPFLGWEKLSSDDLEVSLAPNRLHVATLEVLKPFGKLIIYEDKTLNVKRILRNPAETSPSTGGNSPVPVSNPQPDAGTFPVAIERVRIDNAELDFADLSLTPQFGTRINTLSGVINGLSSDPTTTAQVELDGRVDEYGSARIRGSIQPFKATDFTDLKLTFRNLEMTRLTPYAGKFAGRKIDSGKLSVDLEYKIKNRQLTGTNQFIVNKLRLGERVDSPDAFKLPLDLAIALLEDSNGVIDLDLPVSGSLDDPQFSYGRIIWKAIVNVLTKLVTAPFRALGSLLGISSDKLEAVGFDPGSFKLAPPEQEKLVAVGKAMGKRPALMLTIEPAYDVKADTRALQEAAVRREVAQRLGIQLAPDQPPGPVDLSNPKVCSVLQDMDDEATKKPLYKKLASVFEKPKEGHYAELLEKLTRAVPVTDAALQKLAQSRGDAIQKTLIDAGVAADRASVGAPVKREGEGKGVTAKLSLGAKRVADKPVEASTPQPATP